MAARGCRSSCLRHVRRLYADHQKLGEVGLHILKLPKTKRGAQQTEDLTAALTSARVAERVPCGAPAAGTPTSGPPPRSDAFQGGLKHSQTLHHPSSLSGESRRPARGAASGTELCYPEPRRGAARGGGLAAPRTPAVISPRTRWRREGKQEMGDIVEVQNAQTRRSAGLLPPAAGSGMLRSRGRGGGGGMLHPRSARHQRQISPHEPPKTRLLGVIRAKGAKEPPAAALTPPSSRPSGLSSNVNGRPSATKLSNAASLAIFVDSGAAPHNRAAPRRAVSARGALTCRGTSPCRHRTRS